jgi:hypothetical protein
MQPKEHKQVCKCDAGLPNPVLHLHATNKIYMLQTKRRADIAKSSLDQGSYTGIIDLSTKFDIFSR